MMKKKRITFACSDEFEQRLNDLVKRAHQKRSVAVFKMLDSMVEFLESTEAVGTYDFDFLLRKSKEAMRASAEK